MALGQRLLSVFAVSLDLDPELFRAFLHQADDAYAAVPLSARSR